MSGVQGESAGDERSALMERWPSGPGAPRLERTTLKGLTFERWSSISDDALFELALDCDVEDHILSLPLRRSTVIYDIGRRTVTDNEIFPGDPFLNGPVEQRSRKVYRDGFDVFRVVLPDAILRECLSSQDGEPPVGDIRLFQPHVRRDPVILSLLLAMASASRDPDCHGTYLESLGIALASYLVERFPPYSSALETKAGTPLPPWRLKRVVEYINAHLVENIYLGDLSQVAGLSRMHFAAQFRAATGLTPHSYILQRRIDASRAMLLDRQHPIGDVAKAVGFKDAAHYIGVFRKVMGDTPGRWREIFAALQT